VCALIFFVFFFVFCLISFSGLDLKYVGGILCLCSGVRRLLVVWCFVLFRVV